MNHATSTASPEQVAQAFLTPNVERAGSLGFLASAVRQDVDAPGGRVAVAVAGTGPRVLLVHGWEGRASDLAGVASALLAAGCTVVAIELPAHGDSAGDTTSIPASAEALRAVGEVHGPFAAAIGHSVGTAVLVHAVAAGLAVGRVALFAAPARYADYARGFAKAAGLDAAGTARMIDALRERGVDVDSVSMPRAAATLSQPALFIHSADDRVVPIANAEASVAAWAGARLLRLDGLGHRRLLADATAVAAAVAFVTDAG